MGHACDTFVVVCFSDMVASAEERFNAAVEVIRNLPTNGTVNQ